MTLRKRLLILGLIPVLIASIMIGFILFQIVQIQSSSKEDVQILLDVEQLNGDFIITKQALANYAFNPSESYKTEALAQLQVVQDELTQLKRKLKTEEHIAILQKMNQKFDNLYHASQEALSSGNLPEVKRQSIRISGILNDMHLLSLRTSQWHGDIVDQTKKKIEFIITSSIIGSIILVVGSTFVSWYLGKQITKPIHQLVQQAEQVANGDLTVQLTDDRHKKSIVEIGKLTGAFEHMVHNLKQTVQSVDTIGTEVKQFTEEISNQMQSLLESSNQIAVSTDELARGSQDISENIQSTASLMNSISEEMTHSLQESQQSSHFSSQALTSVKHGRENVQKQRELTNLVSESTDNILRAVEEFANYTSKIEEAANAVTSIAEQTNLLALNAAIEAARAGEAGKGFAVVAEEVRKLADDSKLATESITSMLGYINQGTQAIVDAVRQGKGISQEQMQSMDQIEQSFESIMRNVTKVYDQLDQLCETLTETNHKTENINMAIENISAVTEETAAGTEEISATTEEQVNAFKHMTDQVKVLEQKTEQLKKELERFQL
ncbi:methyl-accepting chemotaxis protein [Aeribacillus pallidus]|uniref:methyl-accepting chemotaxis protein n=1 Tax=Aeribacillus pallidus TaxID=33936 RepID=UPI003D1EDE44